MQINKILTFSVLFMQMAVITTVKSSENQEQGLPFKKIIGQCWPFEDDVLMTQSLRTGEWGTTKEGTHVHLTVETDEGKGYTRLPEKTILMPDETEEKELISLAKKSIVDPHVAYLLLHKNEGNLILPEKTLVAYSNQNKEEQNKGQYTLNDRKTLLPAILYTYLGNKEGIFCPNITQDGNGAIIFNTQDHSTCGQFKKWFEKQNEE